MIRNDEDSDVAFVGTTKKCTIKFPDMCVDLNRSLLSVQIVGPDGNEKIPFDLTKIEDHNSFEIMYTPYQVGCYLITICYDDVPMPGSPFRVGVKNICRPQNCKASGQGLISANTKLLSEFEIDTREAGIGGITLAIEGPAETEIKCIDNKNGSCNVRYIPMEQGDYEISIFFAHEHIPGSPFKVSVTDPTCPDKVKISGPAIENCPIKMGEPTFLDIDVSEAGPGLISVGSGLYTVNFSPTAENMIVDVKFDGQNVVKRFLWLI